MPNNPPLQHAPRSRRLCTGPPSASLRLGSAFRFVLYAVVVAGFFAAALVTAAPRAAMAFSPSVDPNPIVVENSLPGTDTWQLNRPGYYVSDDDTGQIKGYASATSVNKGGSITFYVTVNPNQSYALDIYRIGWYAGAGGRLLQHVGPLNGTRQPACPVDSVTGLIACNWSPAYTLQVPGTWTGGIYLALLTNSQNYQNYIPFVVRDDGRAAPILYQQSVTTYQAYNNYPNDTRTGKSLYRFNSYGANTIAGDRRAVKVSFDRPYAADGGAGQFLEWEAYFIRWMERSGYDVAYSTDLDTHQSGSRLLNYSAFLSVGHDEYWSRQMYDAAQAARDGGVNLGFFGANEVYWQVRFEQSASGAADRVMLCYKDASIDPVGDNSLKTVNWREPVVNRPEQTLVGVQYTAQLPDNNNAPYTVTNSLHWVFAGTGFSNGDRVPGIVGYETDRLMSNYPMPPNTSYTILSRSDFIDKYNNPDYSNSVIYQAPSGARVFAAGTIVWSWALDNFAGRNLADARMQRATANILDNFIARPPTATPTFTLSPTPTRTFTPTFTPTNTATNTRTFTPTNTATNTATSTRTYTPVPTNTPVPTGTATSTPAPAATRTPTPPPAATATPTSTFTPSVVPTGTATATPTPCAQPTPCPMNFSDVRPTDWFYEYVRCLLCRGAISGYSDGTFRPYADATRGQMTKIVVLAFRYLTYTPASPTFLDVPATHPFYQYIETAAHNSIVSGYSDGTFRPYANVTRGQLSKIVVIAAGWPLQNPSTPTFRDVAGGSAFYTYVETAVAHGIVSGYADNTFRPYANATRAQISKIVCLAVRQMPGCP